MINKDQYWQCVPLLPTVDINELVKYSVLNDLTKEEHIRNINSVEIIFNNI